ncbi:hypothetical protein ACQCT5_10550 [Sutcliffiella halmapala]
MFNKKVQTVGSISEFMGRKEKRYEDLRTQEEIMMDQAKTTGKTLALTSTLPLAIAPFAKVKVAAAASAPTYYGEVLPVNSAATTADGIFETMLTAFDPLITLIQALAYPVAMVVALGGCLFIMIDNKEKGFGMMQSAGLGYVLVTLMPMILNILVRAMKDAV